MGIQNIKSVRRAGRIAERDIQLEIYRRNLDTLTDKELKDFKKLSRKNAEDKKREEISKETRQKQQINIDNSQKSTTINTRVENNKTNNIGVVGNHTNLKKVPKPKSTKCKK